MKLVREIDGHKFYTTLHATKSAALKMAKKGFFPVLHDGAWLNFSNLMNNQEDLHES
jgi:hypothetical protein